MSKTFITVLNSLQIESSNNNKIQILKDNKDIYGLRELLLLALDTSITFGVATLPQLNPKGLVTDSEAFELFYTLCKQLSARELTGNKALEEIQKTFSFFTEEQSLWLGRILLKDLASIGLGRSLFDKAYEEKIKFKLGLAEEVEELDNIPDEQDGWCDLKYNGYRTTVYIKNGNVDIIYSGRSGIEAINFYFIKDELERLISELSDDLMDTPNHPIPAIINCVLDGEMHVGQDNHLMTSLYGFKYRFKEEFIGKKGLKEKAWSDYQQREKEILELKSRAKFAIFDYIPMNNWEARIYNKELKDRKKDLAIIGKAIEKLGFKQIEIARSKYCPNKAEGIKVAQEYIDDDFEGGIWKVSDGCYQWKRWRTWIKIKKETTFEIQLVDFVKQEPKYNSNGTLKPDMIGKVLGMDRFNQLQEVGTGEVLSEKTRIDMFNNWTKYKDKIYECSAQEPSKVSGKYINPRLDFERTDRNNL